MTTRSIHEFAALRAASLHTGDLGATLERAGLEPNEWALLEDHWQAALAREAAAGGRELSSQYLAAFRRPDGGAAEPAQALPTYLIAQQKGVPVRTHGSAIEAPSTRFGPVLRPGLPVLSVEQYAWISATLGAATAPELPAALARLRLTQETRAELEAGWNAFLDANPAARAAFMLALGRELEARPSPRAAPLERGPAEKTSLPRMTVALREGSNGAPGPNPDETQLGGMATGQPLPFVPEAAPGPKLPAPPPAPQMERSALAGRTAFGSSGARPSLPFARGKGANLPDLPPGWTLARYAALSIDLYASGLPEDEVLRLAGLTRAQVKALDAYWEARMFDEPSLRAEWKAFADARKAELSK
jgi:hypothetical protein